MFGKNSETAMVDFYQFLSNDASPFVGNLLREIAEELSTQQTIGEIVSKLVLTSYEKLSPTPVGPAGKFIPIIIFVIFVYIHIYIYIYIYKYIYVLLPYRINMRRL
jgi:hypothetical protein